MLDVVHLLEIASEVVAGASVLALGLAKVFPKAAKFGPVLELVHKLLSLFALNHDSKPALPPGPPVQADRRTKAAPGGKAIAGPRPAVVVMPDGRIFRAKVPK